MEKILNRYESEHQGTFDLDGKCFHRVEPHWNGDRPTLEATDDGTIPKIAAPTSFTSYEQDGRYISFFGDNHPVYAGNVVKALASAKDGYSYIVRPFESELFGHERGAFTGADRQKKGLIEGAESGSLFLDEISEIELSIQAKLLRILETRQFRRVGGTGDLQADVRIIAASNCNLEEMVAEGTFRADLCYRLNGFAITVPPLRKRREDIRELVNHFIQNHPYRNLGDGLLVCHYPTRATPSIIIPGDLIPDRRQRRHEIRNRVQIFRRQM